MRIYYCIQFSQIQEERNVYRFGCGNPADGVGKVHGTVSATQKMSMTLISKKEKTKTNASLYQKKKKKSLSKVFLT